MTVYVCRIGDFMFLFLSYSVQFFFHFVYKQVKSRNRFIYLAMETMTRHLSWVVAWCQRKKERKTVWLYHKSIDDIAIQLDFQFENAFFCLEPQHRNRFLCCRCFFPVKSHTLFHSSKLYCDDARFNSMCVYRTEHVQYTHRIQNANIENNPKSDEFYFIKIFSLASQAENCIQFSSSFRFLLNSTYNRLSIENLQSYRQNKKHFEFEGIKKTIWKISLIVKYRQLFNCVDLCKMLIRRFGIYLKKKTWKRKYEKHMNSKFRMSCDEFKNTLFSSEFSLVFLFCFVFSLFILHNRINMRNNIIINWLSCWQSGIRKLFILRCLCDKRLMRVEWICGVLYLKRE